MQSAVLRWGAFAAVALLTAWALWPRGGLRGAGEDLIELALAGDSKGVMRYVDAGEAKAEKLTLAKLDGFLNGFVLKKLSGFERFGPIETFSDRDSGHLIVQQRLRHSDGRLSHLGFDMIKTANGPKCDLVCASLFAAAGAALRPVPSEEAPMEGALETLARWEALLPELEALELEGVMVRPHNFAYWSQLRDSAARRLARIPTGE